MKFSEEFRDRSLVEEITRRIAAKSVSATIMEVCGTHTMSVARFGLKSLLPGGVRMVSGPGCPVCVTDQRDIDCFLALGALPNVTLTSFGDMLRVPGSSTSLERLRAGGADVRVVYSPLDAIDIARENPEREIVFFGIGFETTMPSTAIAIRAAAEAGVPNFTIYSVHKTMPAALRALLSSEDLRVSGLLLPGHVSTIIGADAYTFIAEELHVPCAVAGFEPVDILLAIESILDQIQSGKPIVGNSYKRVVPSQANERAATLIADVFTPCSARWRGVGEIPDSGIAISERYAGLDAERRFADTLARVPTPPETPCRCGDVLRGLIMPDQCPYFGRTCTPTDPIGPCMVSSEGACAAAYRYGGIEIA